MTRDLRFGITLEADGKGFRGEIRATEKDLDRLTGTFGRGKRSSEQYGRAQKQVATETRSAGRSFLEAHGHHVKYLASLGGGYRLLQFARESNQAGVEAEQAGQRFLAAADSAAEAGAEMAFFRAEAERLKLDIAALQQPYSGFLVALKDTSLRGQQARDIFTAVGTAARVLSLDGEALNGVFTALEQIVGKGVVSTEDLRDQLGSRLSGAFAAAARAMEVSTQELGEMLQRGEVAADELLPRLAAELRRTFGADLDSALSTNTAALAEFNNEALKMREAFASAGLLGFEATAKSTAIPVMRTLSANVDGLAASLAGLSAAGGTAFALWAAGAARASLAARGFSAALAAQAVAQAAVAGAAGRLTLATRISGGAMGLAALASRSLTAALAPLAGPAGIILAVGAGTALLTHRARQARPELLSLAEGVDAYRESLNRLSRVQLLGARDGLLKDIEGQAQIAARAAAELSRGFTVIYGNRLDYSARDTERLEAERRDALERMRTYAHEYHEVVRKISGEPPPDAAVSGARAPELSVSARAYLDTLLPRADHIRRRIGELEAERYKLLPDAAAQSDVLAEIGAATAGLRAELAGLESPAAGGDDPLDSLRSRLDGRLAATEEGVRARYARERELIEAGEAGNLALLAALDAEYNETLAGFAAERERLREEEAEALRASGIPALEDMRKRTAELAGVTEFSRDAVARLNRERERELELQRSYPGATEATLRALRDEFDAQDELSQVLEHKIGIIERYNPALAEMEERERAIRELRAAGDLDALQAGAAEADLRIEAGAGSFADGYIAEIQRMREANQNFAAEAGGSFAALGGSLAGGIAQGTTQMLLFGKSSREVFAGVARQALQQFIQQLIQATMQTLILRAIMAAFGLGGVPIPSGGGINPAALARGSGLGSPGQGFSLPGFARGEVVDGAFASGGVIDAPLYFGFGGQRHVGVAGEAGPEAILPLARGPDGNLGVRAAGAGGDRPIQVHIHVNATDADGFDELLRRRRNLIAGMVGEALAEDRRS